MKVSVIIPVYKVEKFITRCADSLLAQTLQDIELIFVDDASPDGSMDLLQSCIDRYPDRKRTVKIMRHGKNKGLPASRNTGLGIASGEYIFHCDSDDFAEPDMLEVLYRTAIEKEADIVWCDWYLSFKHNERYMTQPDYPSPLEALKGMLGGAMKFTVWNKLVKRSLYTDNAYDRNDDFRCACTDFNISNLNGVHDFFLSYLVLDCMIIILPSIM